MVASWKRGQVFGLFSRGLEYTKRQRLGTRTMRVFDAFLVFLLSFSALGQSSKIKTQLEGEAQKHSEEAKAKYQQGNYAEALQLYKNAYILYASPEILYNI